MKQIKCAAPHCEGITNGLQCGDHGAICKTCGIPTTGYRQDGNCGICGARADGEKCGGCGSPWVYLRYHEDHKWRCRPCVSNIIEENGWLKDAETLVASMKVATETIKTEAEKRAERQAEIAERVEKGRKRVNKPRQEEGLFVLEDPKKKRKT